MLISCTGCERSVSESQKSPDKVCATATLQEDAQRWEDNGENDLHGNVSDSPSVIPRTQTLQMSEPVSAIVRYVSKEEVAKEVWGTPFFISR